MDITKSIDVLRDELTNEQIEYIQRRITAAIIKNKLTKSTKQLTTEVIHSILYHRQSDNGLTFRQLAEKRLCMIDNGCWVTPFGYYLK